MGVITVVSSLTFSTLHANDGENVSMAHSG